MLDLLPQLLVNALISGSLYALMSSGLSLSYGLLGVLNFSHGQTMMVGAYLLLYFLETCKLSLVSASVCTFFSVLALGAIVFNVFVRPFTRFDMVLTLVTTLALANMLENGVAMLFGVNVKSYPSTFDIDVFELGPIFVTNVQVFIIFSALILLTLLALLIHKTSFGRAVRAVSENAYASQSLGISRQKLNYVVFIGGTVFATLSGILLAYETNLSPTMGGTLTIKCFAAMILGGLGNIWGTVIGSYILGLIENLSVGVEIYGYSIPAGYKDAVAFMTILVVLLFFPNGIFNKKAREF